jgi:hypothetical protein
LIKLPCRKVECSAYLLLILASAFLAVSFLPEARATTTLTSLTPSEGDVGSTVMLQGNITTLNGTFQLLWDNLSIATASAVRYVANVSFTVPPATLGNHVVTLVDVAKGESATENFYVLTAYSLDVLPELAGVAQRQEGDAVQISLNMTGGVKNQAVVANITVTAPNNASYTSSIDRSNFTTADEGNGSLSLKYPDDFSVEANTNFTGQYGVFFNTTFASTTFFAGLTNSSEYHRNQAVDVKTVYAPGENVTLSITGPNLNYTESRTADNVTGKVEYMNPTILSNASIGVYTVNLTSVSGLTRKDPPDVQNFTVPGFPVNITTRNLAAEPVQYVLVSVFENLNPVYNLTSDVDGSALASGAVPKLEVGNYACNASFGGQDVGRLAIAVNETNTGFDLYCNLTNLVVVVVDQDGILIPGVDLSLGLENKTSTITIAPTDVNGTSIVHSLLPLFDNAPINYALNASRYGTLFNSTTLLQLPVKDWFTVTIVCPRMNLHVNVTDVRLQPIKNAEVDAIEEMGGPPYSNITSADGTLTLRLTFGRYLVRVYADGIELNETTVDLNYTTVNATINCELYGLDVLVRVSDYFGQSIPNLNVTLQRTGYQNSSVSGSDGLAAFNGIVGGDLQLAVHSVGQSDPLVVMTTTVSNSTTIEIRLGKYFLLAGMLVDMSQFVTVIIIFLFVIFIVCLEVYLRRRTKAHQTGS